LSTGVDLARHADGSDNLRALIEDIVEERVEECIDERVTEATADLRAELEQKDEQIDALEARIEELKAQPTVEFRENSDGTSGLGSLFIGDHPVGARINGLDSNLDSVEGSVEDLRADLVAEQKTRSQHDSLVERRVAAVAEKAGVDISDEDLVDDDKIAQLLRVGPDAITDRVYPVHRRARTMLESGREWGTLVSDENAVRIVFKAPEVRPYLDARFDREFSTSEIERIFSKVEDLAADSPRKVRKRKTDEGHHMLAVWAMHEEDPLLTE
jgi:archaellum component FlaC